jgi:HPP family
MWIGGASYDKHLGRGHILRTVPPTSLSTIVSMPAVRKPRLLPRLNRQPWATLVPDDLWAPVTGALLIFVVGVLGLVAHRPWIFASLGPTAYLHAENPEHRSSRFYNTVVGHLVALGSGFFALWVLNAWSAPDVMATGHLTMVRVAASTIAIGLTVFLVLGLHASHQPAGATTLLVALGTFQSFDDAIVVIVGVVLIAAIGEPIRRLRIGKPPL